MIDKIVYEIERTLKAGDFENGIYLMRKWLSTCQGGEPEKLLQASSPKMQPNVTLLMRDLLSRYPNTLVGCPLLMYCTREENPSSVVPTHTMTLPFPSPKNAKPCSHLQFLGWLSCDTQLPVCLPLDMTRYKSKVEWGNPTAYTALFRVNGEGINSDEITVPSGWWAEVFIHGNCSDQVGNVRIEGNMLFDYPSSLEVAKAMQAGARGDCMPAVSQFEVDLNWAYELGIVFLEKCRA